MHFHFPFSFFKFTSSTFQFLSPCPLLFSPGLSVYSIVASKISVSTPNPSTPCYPRSPLSPPTTYYYYNYLLLSLLSSTRSQRALAPQHPMMA